MEKFGRITSLPADVYERLMQMIDQGKTVEVLSIDLKKQGFFTDTLDEHLELYLDRYIRYMKNTKGVKNGDKNTPTDSGEIVALRELEALARLQKRRVESAMEKEKDMPMPLETNNRLIESYQSTLESLHRAQIADRDAAKKFGTADKPANSISEQINEAIVATERAMQGLNSK